MIHSQRFRRIAQLLFTSDISDDENALAQKIVDIFDKAELDFQDWVDSIENNLEVFKNYHGKENSLVVISEVFEETMAKQKEKYEKIIGGVAPEPEDSAGGQQAVAGSGIKQAIELLNKIQDVEMQDMVTNLTKASEEFTEMYNELTDMQLKIGEPGFIQEFKDLSQKLLDNNEPFFDVLSRIRDYMMKNILGEQALS
jgi:hypothetical protein